jgi:hypothetical protein
MRIRSHRGRLEQPSYSVGLILDRLPLLDNHRRSGETMHDLKRKLTMYFTPAMKTKLQALAKSSGCSLNYLVEACFRMAIQCFEGNTTELLKLLARQNAKPKERHSIPLSARPSPAVYEGLQKLHSRSGAAVRGRLRRQKQR